MMLTRIVLFIATVLAPLPLSADEDTGPLPNYHIEINPDYLELMNERPVVDDRLYVFLPQGDTYFPAMFFCEGDSLPCEVRHRGSWSLFLPRRSWRIKFDNSDNVFHAERINLNSEYTDHSAMRNFLCNRLFQYLGYPAPDTKHVNFHVNGEYMGVFSQIENVDEEFLERYGREPGNLYKLGDHGGGMAPLTNYYRYTRTWAKKIGDPLDYTDIQLLFNKIAYRTKDDFDTNIGDEVDIDNILNYFAVMYAIVGGDSFTKNYYLYSNPDTGRFEIFPWDTDDSFPPGGYQADKGMTLDYHALFQRLMDNELWHGMLLEKLDGVTGDGFTYLDGLLTVTRDRIRNEIYRDDNRDGSNVQFELDVEDIRTFLKERRAFIEDNPPFIKKPFSEYYCSNPFPSADNPTVFFRVKADGRRYVTVEYTDDLDFSALGSEHTKKTLRLFDDGAHDDGEAGDYVYGGSFTMPEDYRGIIPFTFMSSLRYSYPHNGLFYIQWIRSNSLALNCLNPDVDIKASIELGDIYRLGDDIFVEIRNRSDKKADISYCHLRGDEYYLDFLLPENTVVPTNRSIIVTSNTRLAEKLFDHTHAVFNRPVGNLYYDIAEGDSIRLLSPTLSIITVKKCAEIHTLEAERRAVVFTEINYNSAEDFDTEDWVELHNPDSESVDITGWVFKDEEDDHAFVFPGDTVIGPGGYLVLTRKAEWFRGLFPNVPDNTGDFDFGLSNGGERIRLFDERGEIVDEVGYDDDPPWPVEPDGGGATLALKSPDLDNSTAESWGFSPGHGTPGKDNNGSVAVGDETAPPAFSLGQNYPNPFNGATTIPFSVPHTGNVCVEVYSVLGQRIATILDGRMTAGDHAVEVDARGLAAGVYFYRIKTGGRDIAKPMLYLK